MRNLKKTESKRHQNKVTKPDKLAATHVFYPFAIETAGTWDVMVIELTQEIGRRITSVTGETRETTFLFQRLSMALQTGNAVSFQHTLTSEWDAVATIWTLLTFHTHAYRLCAGGPKIMIIIIIIINRFKKREIKILRCVQTDNTIIR